MADEIAQFIQAAESGKLVYTADTARQAAAVYDPVIEELKQLRNTLRGTTNLAAFGGFPSAKALQGGFQDKVERGIEYLDKFLAAHYRVQYAFLKAGKLYDEAEAANAAAVRATNQYAEDQKAASVGNSAPSPGFPR